jgi:hypothetical protein
MTSVQIDTNVNRKPTAEMKLSNSIYTTFMREGDRERESEPDREKVKRRADPSNSRV